MYGRMICALNELSHFTVVDALFLSVTSSRKQAVGRRRPLGF
jgi:hypothetical protein